MQVGLFSFRYEFIADVRRPEVSRGWPSAPESLLKLIRMKHLNKLLWVALARQHDLKLGLRVDKHLYTVVECALSPANMRVKRTEQEVHEVMLADVSKGQDLLTWQ